MQTLLIHPPDLYISSWLLTSSFWVPQNDLPWMSLGAEDSHPHLWTLQLPQPGQTQPSSLLELNLPLTI